jgi:Flp pilus assembly protein TadD
MDYRMSRITPRSNEMLAGALLTLLLASPVATDALLPPNPMEMSPEMKQFVSTRIDARLSPMQRLQSLVSTIFQNKELNFAYSPVSRSARETFEQHNGNCLSFTLLFISMARYVNLDARFCEVRISPAFSRNGDFVVLNQHLRPVVFVSGQIFAVDIFPQIVPMGLEGQVVSDERGIAHFYSNKGVDELATGNYGLAEDYFNRSLATDPTMAGALINLGTSRSRQGMLDEAERYYRKALDLNPKSQAAMNNLASICMVSGRTQEALRLKKKIQRFLEQNPYYHFNLGLQADQQGNYEEAIAQYRRAIKLNSTDHTFYFAIARLYAQVGRKNEAVSSLLLAQKYAHDPDNKLKYAQKLDLIKSARSQ